MKKHIKLIRFWRTWKAVIVLGTALILILLCVTGCTRNISVSDYCLLYRPVYADYDNDTPETIKQIDSNNIVYDTVCDDK